MELHNRKAFHDYYFDTRYNAGMVLQGTEIKSLREGKVSFGDSFCFFNAGELFVRSLHIPEYKFGTYTNHDPVRDRKLLLSKRELQRLATGIKEKGYTIIPLKIFLSESGYFKIEIGLGKGKKAHDKRETIRSRDVERDLRRRYK